MNSNTVKDIQEVPGQKLILLPITANPLHAGHVSIYNYLDDNGFEPVFVVSEAHVSKTVSDEVLNTAIKEFESRGFRYFVSRHGRYSYIVKSYKEYLKNNKVARFWEVSLAMGSDAYQELVNTKHYFDSEDDMRRELFDAMNGVPVVVFPRGDVRSLEDMNKLWRPEYLDVYFAKDFKLTNISSGQIRNRNK